MKNSSILFRAKYLQQNMQFDVDADIYMAKKKNVILIAYNVK